MSEVVKSILSDYVGDFLSNLEEHCQHYKMLGMGTHESPMWFQLRGYREGEFVFKNSQNPRIWFTIPIDEEHRPYFVGIDSDIVYNFFRDTKYKYIEGNHPTVYSEIK